MKRTTASLCAISVVHLGLTFGLLVVVATYMMPYHFFCPGADAGNGRSLPRPVELLHKHLYPITGVRVHGDAAVVDGLNTATLASSTAFHLAMAALTYATVTLVITPPFGRHAPNTRVSFTLPARLSWALQESPTVWNVLYHLLLEYPLYMGAAKAGATYPSLVREAMSRFHIPILLFVMHYVHRSFVYPLVVSARANQVPIHVTWSATLYCLFNGRLQVLAALALASPFDGASAANGGLVPDFTSVRCVLVALGQHDYLHAVSALLVVAVFLLGSLLFFYGMYVNMSADYYLVTLKERKEQSANGDYQIPYGGWFDKVSCPNFFGEIVEWTGYALVIFACTWFTTQSTCQEADLSRGMWGNAQTAPALAAASFVIYVLANLVPRGQAHHAWYIGKFGDTYARLGRAPVFPSL